MGGGFRDFKDLLEVNGVVAPSDLMGDNFANVSHIRV